MRSVLRVLVAALLVGASGATFAEAMRVEFERRGKHMWKPCVAGIDRLMTKLDDGQRGGVDGTAGVIRILS